MDLEPATVGVAGNDQQHLPDSGTPPGLRSARQRLVAAVVAEVAEVGYAHATVAGICVRAWVPRAGFDAEFRSKEECFRAACQDFADALIARVRERLEGVQDAHDGVRAGLAALLGFFAEHPTTARVCLVEGLAAGPAVLAVRDVAMRAFAELVEALHVIAPTGAGSKALVSEASVGGVYGIILRRIREGDTAALPGLVSELAYFVLAPVVGCPEARLELACSA